MLKKSVLIVEDEEHIAAAQSLILKVEYDVHHAKDGEEGWKKAQALKPDVVVLDIMLPKMNGLDVCKKIRSDTQLSSTKVVMVTAKDHTIDEMRGIGSGADDYIMKPFEAEELLHVVRQVLRK